MTNADYLKLAYIARKRATTHEDRTKFQLIINKLEKAIRDENQELWSRAC